MPIILLWVIYFIYGKSKYKTINDLNWGSDMKINHGLRSLYSKRSFLSGLKQGTWERRKMNSTKTTEFKIQSFYWKDTLCIC